MQRRVQALAAERSIPPADFAKLLHKRVGMNAVATFCEKHKVSMDWLLCVDLKGLQRTTKEAKAAPPSEIDKARCEEVGRLFLTLTAQKQAFALDLIRELMARSIPNG